MDARTDRPQEGFEDIPISNDPSQPTALVVGADDLLELAIRAATAHCDLELHAAPAGDGARIALLERRYDLVLLALPARSSTSSSFVSTVSRLAPQAQTIILCPTLEARAVVDAMRQGAVDWLQLPFDPNEFRSRVLAAVERCREERSRDESGTRLEGIRQRLEDVRAESGNDTSPAISDEREAPEETEDRMDEIAMTAEYRTLLRQELDLEDLLRVGVEYLIQRTGPTNAAIFLPGADSEWSLGAYVNCDCPRTAVSPMLERLAADLCPELAKTDELMRFEDTAEFVDSLGLGTTSLGRCEMVAWPCHARTGRDGHESMECLAIFILFRDKAKGFEDGLAATIDVLRGVFAEQVATVLRVHHRATGGWPDEAADHRDESEGDWDEGRKAA